jgi:hypothetical protein
VTVCVGESRTNRLKKENKNVRHTIDGNEATARVAYALSEAIAIYPITPGVGFQGVVDGGIGCGCGECTTDRGALALGVADTARTARIPPYPLQLII